MSLLLLLLCLSILPSFESSLIQSFLEDEVEADFEQSQAVKALICRVLPTAKASRFEIRVNSSMLSNDGKDIALIDATNGTVTITASSGVAASWAFNHYIKYFCNCQVGWQGHKQLEDLPDPLPEVQLELKAQDQIRYYQNVCLYGYSFVWWNWLQWETHLDWMAMNGYNLALAMSGQEWIMMKTLKEFGMSEKEILAYFSGPAFLPWNRMGNIQSWGGPLPMSWIEKDRELQKKILLRMRSLGIRAVYPAFNGFLPRKMIELYPNVSYDKLGYWGHFNKPYDRKYSGSILFNVSSPLVANIRAKYLANYASEYGNTNFFSLDTFNEITPPYNKSEFFSNYAEEVYAQLKAQTPNAVWVLQGWMFLYDSFWTPEKAKSLLTAVPRGKLLVLDLSSATNPQYDRLEGYFGQPFIYCMLHNYGGTLGFYGKASTVNEGPHRTRLKYPSMSGIGVTPEGIHNSYVMYELMAETGWRNEPIGDLNEWFANYSSRRYGKHVRAQSAWRLLGSSVFECCNETNNNNNKLPWVIDEKKEFRFHGVTTLTELPGLDMRRREWWYDNDQVLRAWDEMIIASSAFMKRKSSSSSLLPASKLPPTKAANCSIHEEAEEKMKKERRNNNNTNNLSPFEFDVIDVTRQAMTNALYDSYARFLEGFRRCEVKKMQSNAKKFLHLAWDVDRLLSFAPEFLLGRWVQAAKDKAEPAELLLFEFNAKNQITLWGPRGEILDYAGKQWSGLIRDYYIPRWNLFFASVIGGSYDKRTFKQDFLDNIGIPFTKSTKIYPTRAAKNALRMARKMHKKWRKQIWAQEGDTYIMNSELAPHHKI